jgi:hypothetical protein
VQWSKLQSASGQRPEALTYLAQGSGTMRAAAAQAAYFTSIVPCIQGWGAQR